MTYLKHFQFLSLLCFLSCGCVYRFTNKHIRNPGGGRSIAIAPIFDSSRTVIPHDVLWTSLQNAFASTGHLTVTSTSKADFFLQAHVKDSVSREYESDSTSTLRDAHAFQDSAGSPIPPKNFVNLHAAEIFSKRERLTFTVLVEVWDLRNKTLFLKKEYHLSSGFNMFSVPPPPKESHYIRNEENAELSLIGVAKSFSQNVVDDLFSTSHFVGP